MDTTFKVNTPLCRHGMRDDCPTEQCRIRVQHAIPSVLYSTPLKGPVAMPRTPVSANPTGKNVSLNQPRQFGAHDKGPKEVRISQLAKPAPLHLTLDESPSPVFTPAPSGGAMAGEDLSQAVDGLSFVRGLLDSQLATQMAKIYAMSSHFHMPISDLSSNAFRFTPLPLVGAPVANAVPPTTPTVAMTPMNNGSLIWNEPVFPIAPAAPLLKPAQPVSAIFQPQGVPITMQTTASGPPIAAAPRPPRQSTLDQRTVSVSRPAVPAKNSQGGSTALKKDEMAYKTTPCRHFTLNNGWCPWGEECSFIHDPELEWLPRSGRSSGRSESTPSSTMLANKSALPDKTTGLIVSSKGAHCWGYIQGICPHSDKCRYFHPDDIVPYIKYTPCLSWPRCGYPAQLCPLKHPQVDKLTPQHRNQQPTNPTTTLVLPQPRESNVPRAETYSDTRAPPQLQMPPVMPSPLPATEGLVIPHDEAYASAMRHHRPTTPSPETFSPAPVGPAVRIRRPSEDVPRNKTAARCGPSLGTYQGRARSVSIAVQKLDAEFAGAAQRMQVKVGGKGHGRGKSMNL